MSSNSEIFDPDPSAEAFPSAESSAGEQREHRPAAQELPPVEPPSASFIIQLFLVPGLIVAAVVGVWALFGQLAAGKQDWRPLVVDLSSQNNHRRWRAAHGLAQMLQADRQRESEGESLARNPVVIKRLTGLFEEELKRESPAENDLLFQVFLARTMGLLDDPDRVLPTLRTAMSEEHDREVRKNAIASVAVIAGRARERETRLNDASVVHDLIDISQGSDRLLRQLAAYTLGLIPTADSRDRLRVMLDDPDLNTRLNSAIGLARSGSTDGIGVFHTVLRNAAEPFDPRSVTIADRRQRQVEIQDRRYQRDLRLKNTLDAVESLVPALGDAETGEMIELLRDVAEANHIRREFRARAQSVRQKLSRDR